VSPVKYELGSYIPEDEILHSHCRENLKSYLEAKECNSCSSPFIACLHYPATRLTKLGSSLCLVQFKNQATIFPPPKPNGIHHSEFHSSFLSHLVFLHSLRRLLVAACVVPSSPILVTLMKEAPDSSETSVLTRVIPEDTILHSHRRENLKSYTNPLVFASRFISLWIYQGVGDGHVRVTFWSWPAPTSLHKSSLHLHHPTVLNVNTNWKLSLGSASRFCN
jgi:hypothetical protein